MLILCIGHGRTGDANLRFDLLDWMADFDFLLQWTEAHAKSVVNFSHYGHLHHVLLESTDDAAPISLDLRSKRLLSDEELTMVLF